KEWLDEAQGDAHQTVHDNCLRAVNAAWEAKKASIPPHVMPSIQRSVLLQTLDRLWRQHLQSLEFLRRGIGLRGYAQKDPLNEYARESYHLFEHLLAQTKKETVALLSRVQIIAEEDVPQPTQFTHPDESGKPVTEALPLKGKPKAGGSKKNPPSAAEA